MLPERALRWIPIPALLLLATAGCGSGPAPIRVSVVGLDGATWRVIDPLLERGELPYLGRLVERGTRAELRSIPPLVSPAVWTSIATGVARGRHGIRGFLGWDGHLVSSLDRRRPALWSLASRHGLRSAVIGWWATYPAESIEGVVVSDRALATRRKSFRRVVGESSLGRTEVARMVHPPDAFAVLDELLAQPVPGGEDLDDFDVPATMRLEDTTVARSLLRLRESHGPFDLELVLLRGVDPVSHHFWQYHEPDARAYSEAERPAPEDVARFGSVVADHYRYVDALLGEILGASPKRVIVVLSDHGFEAGSQEFQGRTRLLGTHRSRDAEVGVFLAAGGPVRRGAALGEVSILDVAPTLLRLLGLPVADDLEGRVLTEALDPDWRTDHPAERVAGYPGPPVDLPEATRDVASPVDGAVEEELRSLGYIE